jgi:two-component system nitrate/nitrite sensor histidine kinase NarX
MGIGLPLLFVGVLYTLVEEQIEDQVGHLAIALMIGVLVVAFAGVMFALIDRAQRRIVVQNRELAAINGVSSAIQGELATETIVDSALESIVASTGALEASLSVTRADEESTIPSVLTTRRVVAPGVSGEGDRGEASSEITVPLLMGTSVLGRLRIIVPAEAPDLDPLSSNALQNIAQQLACAIEMSQLVESLQRRRQESSALYELALQVTNQYALSDILGTTVRYARELLGADDGVICLNEPTSRAMKLDGVWSGLPFAPDGTACISPDPGLEGERHGNQPVCPVRSSPAYRATLEAPLRTPDGSLGDLWVGRAAAGPFGSGDRALLTALADLAAIAVTTARTRQVEREAAILAERERIAREMHDSLAQVLATTHVQLRGLAAGEVRARLPEAADKLDDLADLADEAFRDVREAILGLRTSSRTGGSLLAGLAQFVEKWGRQSGISATLDLPSDGDLGLAPGAEIQVIRVIQEALTNVRKHAEATSARVSVVREADAVTITVEDDGRGFDVTGALLGGDGSFGLHTMHERMELVGGSLSIVARPGQGTRVIARVPVAGAAVPIPSPAPALAIPAEVAVGSSTANRSAADQSPAG